MFEKPEYKCPNCGLAIGADLTRLETFKCPACWKTFAVSADPDSGHVALFDHEETTYPDPLWMPKGSIRALVSLLVSGCFWYLVAVGADVPVFLMSLILAVIGYYFGFRVREKAADSRIYDPAIEKVDPLLLPSGCIRSALTAGFLVTAGVLAMREHLGDEKYMEFFLILAGLVFGHFFAKGLRAVPAATVAAIGHVKALCVVSSAMVLVAMLISDNGAGAVPLTLACIVSFYFGSRS